MKLFEDIEERRNMLNSSEQLFDNPLADYSLFIQSQNDYSCLEKIYDIYERQKETLETWSQIQWIDLDADFLMNGIESFLKEFRFYLRFLLYFS